MKTAIEIIEVKAIGFERERNDLIVTIGCPQSCTHITANFPDGMLYAPAIIGRLMDLMSKAAV